MNPVVVTNLQFIPETNALCLDGNIFMSSLDTQWRLMSPTPCLVAFAQYFQTLVVPLSDFLICKLPQAWGLLHQLGS